MMANTIWDTSPTAKMAKPTAVAILTLLMKAANTRPRESMAAVYKLKTSNNTENCVA